MNLGTQRYIRADTRAIVALKQNGIPLHWVRVIDWWQMVASIFQRKLLRCEWLSGATEIRWPEDLCVARLLDGRRLIRLPDGQTILHQPSPDTWLMYVDETWRRHFMEQMEPRAEEAV